MNAYKEIKNLLNISTVASSYTKLVKVGDGKYRGLCPLHSEKTPSFYVNDNYGSYYCFGCKSGGDLFSLIEHKEHLKGYELLNYTAQKYGLNIEIKELDNTNKEENAQKIEQLSILKLFVERFSQYSVRKKMTDYLQKRFKNINQTVINNLGIFYVPFSETQGFIQSLTERQLQIAEEIGLVRRYLDKVYTPFAGRIVFPIKHNGDIVALNGRAIHSQKNFKYVLTSSGKIFHKNLVLYGLSEANRIAAEQKKNYVYVCEGVFDSIALLMNGIPAVSVLGSSISLQQFTTLAKNFSTIYLALDNDNTGIEGTEKIVQKAFESEVITHGYIVKINEGKDVNEFLYHHTLEEFLELPTISFEDAIINYHIRSTRKLISNSSNVEELKKRISAKLIPQLYDYKNNEFSHSLLMRYSERLGVDPSKILGVLDSSIKKLKYGIIKEEIKKEDNNLSLPITFAELKILSIASSNRQLIEKIKTAEWYPFISVYTKDLLDIIYSEEDVFEAISHKHDSDSYAKILMFVPNIPSDIIMKEFELINELMSLRTEGSKNAKFILTVKALRRKTSNDAAKEAKNDLLDDVQEGVING